MSDQRFQTDMVRSGAGHHAILVLALVAGFALLVPIPFLTGVLFRIVLKTVNPGSLALLAAILPLSCPAP